MSETDPVPQPEPKVLLLVDGSSYLYRAFHAMPDLRAVPGDPASPATGAIRGMINMLQKLRRDVRADYAAVVFDAPGTTFRDDLYPDYKATRSPMPDDLRAQIPPIHEVVRLLGWKVLHVPGVEADDVIGTLSCLGTERGMVTIISSGDKDLSQLVNEQVTVIDTMNDRRRDLAGVELEFGVPPRLMIDYQTLVGDAVDNVPGVDKVGPKTAVKLLKEYGSLDNLVARAADLKGAVGENIRRALDWLPKGRELLTIRTSCDLKDHIPGFPELEDIVISGQDVDQLKAFYERFGFKGLVRQLEDHAVAPELIEEHKKKAARGALPGGPFEEPDLSGLSQATTLHYETVFTWDAFDTWLQRIAAAPLVALDTETDSLDEMLASIVGLSFSPEPGLACYIPLAHDYQGAPDQLPRDEVLRRLKPWLENPDNKKLGQHIKYDRHVFANHGIEVQGYQHDTMLESYVLEVHKPHGLASLAERHLGRTGIDYETVAGKGVHQITFNQVPVDQAAEYSCEDSDQTLDVHLALWPKLEKESRLRFVYDLEMQSSEVLFRVERNGVLIDAEGLSRQSHELGQRIMQLEREAHELAGQPFNLGSPKQIGEIFFGKLGLPVVKKTASGAPSTDEEVLEKLAEDFPLPAKVLEHRSLSKLKGTYTDKLPLMVHAGSGRVHTHYAQAVAVTGRLSSNDPNLQNIPIRTAEGRRIREAFVAPPGCRIASADYSQIELRIMAHISEDAALLRAFREDIDVHRATASEVFGVGVDEVSSEQRRYAKVINFGLIYGMSSFGLARNLGIENAAARNYIERYFQRYPGVKQYMDETRLSAKSRGYVETVFGRRLYLPEINSPNGPRRGSAERQAINAPMQGTAADLIKLSMVKVQQVLEREQRGTRMIMQVHDELVFEVPEAEVEWARGEIPRLMAGVAELRVPLLAEFGVGANWDEGALNTLPFILFATLAAGIGSVWCAAGLMRLGWGPDPQVRGLKEQHLLSLAAGALLATAFMHLLPEALESPVGAKALFATLLVGVVFFFLLDKAELWHHGHEHHRGHQGEEGHAGHAHDHPSHDPVEVRSGGWPVLAGDSVHCFGDGILIASAFIADAKLGVVAALAVLAHEVPHHIGDLAVLRQTSRNRRAAIVKVSLAGAVTPLGGLMGWWLVDQLVAYLPYFLVVASSSFIYVALADLIPQLQKRLGARETLAQIAWLFAGIALVMVVSGLAH